MGKPDELDTTAMSPTLQIVVDVIFSVLGFIFIVWLAIRTLKRTEEPVKMIFKWVFSIAFVIFCIWTAGQIGLGGPFLIVFMAVVLSPIWSPHIGEWLSKPLTGLYDGGDREVEPRPYYSVARSLRMKGKYPEAVVETRSQLERFPTDMEGAMLLAGIQAEDLKDLPGAEITLRNFYDSPGAPPKQVAAALTQLADWHLKLAQDAEAARAALEKIIARYPDTELSLQAAQRIAHLGGAEKILLAAHDRQPMAVPEGVKNVGLLQSSEFLRPAEKEPGQLAVAYVKHLEQHPLDVEIREKLAIIYADHYQRLDLATGELKQLIEYPNQPAKRVAHWLNLLADLQVRSGADYDTVRETLEKVVERFSNSAVAELARARLAHLKLELKGQKETPGVKLGVYEQKLGLKQGSLGRQL
jgi:outer membrane protein assembly factor BamD (BamD/ComL family)